MRNILHTAAAVAAATALLLTPVANASSLSSSSGNILPAPSEPTEPTEPTPPTDPTEPEEPTDPTDPGEDRPGAEVVSEIETALARAGHVVDPELTAVAQHLADDWTGAVELGDYISDLVKAGYFEAKARSYMGPNGLEHHIKDWQEGHKDLPKITGKYVGVAFSTEPNSIDPEKDGWDQVWIVFADKAAAEA